VALVAVPTSELVLVHLFKDTTMAHKDVIAGRMAELASLVFERSDERQQVSRSVYISHEDQWLVLDDVHAGASTSP